MLKRMMWLVLFCAVALPGQAIVNGTAPAEDDTRFDAVGAFGHTNRLNRDMGHRDEHNWYGAGVLIAPDVVLTAKHLLPNGVERLPRAGAMTFRFRRHADGSLGTRRGGAASYHQAVVERFIVCESADLMLCILREPVEHIEPARIDLTGEALDAVPVMLAGWGSESNWQGTAVPRSQLLAGSHTATANGRYVRLASFETESREKPNGNSATYIIEENAVANMHDSGGAMFLVEEDEDLFLIGIIATYQAGTWVGPFLDDEAFPLRAACRGSEALLEALGDEE